MTILNLMKMAQSSSKWIENTVGKEKNYSRHVKTRACLGKNYESILPLIHRFNVSNKKTNNKFVLICRFRLVFSVYKSASDNRSVQLFLPSPIHGPPSAGVAVALQYIFLFFQLQKN